MKNSHTKSSFLVTEILSLNYLHSRDEIALSQLISHLKTCFKSKLSTYTLLHADEKDDVIAITIINIWKKLESGHFENNKTTHAYYMRMLLNEANDLHKKNSQKVALLQQYKLEVEHNALENALEKENEQLRLLNYLIPILSTKQRDCILMYYFKKYSIKKIAEITNSNPNTVKSDLSRAKDMLKAKMPKSSLPLFL
jgi:RNA polymerase sigma-70 factor (ECF subfamily)